MGSRARQANEMFPSPASDARIRIAFALPSLGAGGAERVVVTLVRLLDRTRFDPVLVLADRRAEALRAHVPPDVDVFHLNAKRVIYSIRGYANIISQLRPDIVFSTLDHLNLALSASRSLWPPSTTLVVRPTLMAHARPWLDRAMMRILYAQADCVVLQSPEMEIDYRRSVGGRSRTCTISNPVDIEDIRGRSKEISLETNFEFAQFNLVAVGRLEYQKGFDILLDAVSHLDRDVGLTILGDGSQRTALERQTIDRGMSNRVRFLGYVANPYPYIARADRFVLSSRYEGFPNVVLEALACGTPVVAMPVDSSKRLLSGRLGCEIANRFDAQALAEAIQRSLAQGNVRLPQDAADEFAGHVVVGQYEALFNELVAGAHRDNGIRTES